MRSTYRFHKTIENMNPRDQITYVQTTYRDRIPQTVECLKRVSPYVDRIVLVQEDFRDQDEERLEEQANGTPIQIIYKPWLDCFSCQRNRYLSAVQDGWVLISDPDEWFNPVALRMLRELVEHSAFGSRYNIVAFNSHDTTYTDDYKSKIESHASGWWKQLLYKYYPGMHYTGIVHEAMLFPPDLHIRGVPAPPDAWYEHVKTKAEVTERGVRNFFTGGGGVNDQGREFPAWKELRARLLLEHGIETFKQFNDYLKAGNIAPWLAEWIVKYRNWNERAWMGSEVRQMWHYYFKRLHPNEKPEGVESDFPE